MSFFFKAIPCKEKHYSPLAIDEMKNDARLEGYKSGYKDGVNAVEKGEERLAKVKEEMAKSLDLMRRRKTQLALKLMDAITRGDSARLIDQWDKKTEFYEKNPIWWDEN